MAKVETTNEGPISIVGSINSINEEEEKKSGEKLISTVHIRYFFLCWAIIAIFIILSVAFLLFQIMINQYYEELYKVNRIIENMNARVKGGIVFQLSMFLEKAVRVSINSTRWQRMVFS